MLGEGALSALDELGLRRLPCAGAGDRPGTLAPPALMPLTGLVAVPPPGHVPEVRAIIADDVDVGTHAADQPRHLSLGVGLIVVVLLDEDVVARRGLG